MTKLVFISDTHGEHDRVRVPPCDILVHSGDCTNDIGQRSLREFLKWLHRQPCEHSILVAGNHDGAFEKWPDLAKAMVGETSPRTHLLQDSGVEINGIKFWGSPYTPSFMEWYFMRDMGDKIKRHWDFIPGDTDVLVTHGPPFGFLDKSNNWNESTGKKWDDCLGCRDLLEAMYRVRPMVHAFGHIHGGYGWDIYIDDDGHRTTLVNASQMNENYQMVNQPIVFDDELNRITS